MFVFSPIIEFFTSTACPIETLFSITVPGLKYALGPTLQFSPIYTGPSTYVPLLIKEPLPKYIFPFIFTAFSILPKVLNLKLLKIKSTVLNKSHG